MAKTKLQRLKSCRPSPGHLEISRWIREQEARLGIKPQAGQNSNALAGGASGINAQVGDNSERAQPTITVYPSARTIERLAHYGADLLIANNPAYDSMCARLDAELAEISDGSVGLAATRSKSNHGFGGLGPRVLMND